MKNRKKKLQAEAPAEAEVVNENEQMHNDSVLEEKSKKTKKKNECDELRERVDALTKELDAAALAAVEQNDKYLRMAAEYENFRRRSKEERSATYESALADAVSELLPILDNLERAAQFTDGEQVREGLKMIAASVDGALSKLGVERFGKPGDKFDPNLHNAVMHEEAEGLGEGEITDVFQTGYKKGNKIIRFAMVKSVN